MALKYLNAEELERWKAQNPGKTYFDAAGNPVGVPSTTKDLGFIGNLARTVSKPFRMGGGVAQEFGYTLADLIRMAQGKEQLERPQKYLGLTQEESQALYQDPLKEGLKSSAGIMSYAVPVGAAKGATGLKAVKQAAGKSAGAGVLGGFGLSESGQELESALKGAGLGAVMGGALQGVGEIGRKISKPQISKTGMDVYLNEIDDVTKVTKLPKEAKNALKKLSESAGFKDPSLSESKNILNYLNNRKLAGITPGQTLENMTQEFARASRLKQEGLEEIGGLSRSYLEQAKNSFDDAIRYKGLSLDKEGTGVYNDIAKTFLKGPQDAKSLDNILMKWNEAGRNAKGAQKLGLSGLYADASKALRDVLRTTNPGGKYDTALRSLSQILGLDDEGVVSAAAQAVEKTGVNIPMFQNAGVFGADIKTPAISNAISKTRANIGQKQLERALGSQVGQAQSTQAIPQLLQTIINAGQRTIPAVTGLSQAQPTQPVQQPIQQQLQQLPSGVNNQEVNALNLMLAQEVLSGNISAADANAVLSLLGMGGVGKELSGNQSKAQALQSSLDTLKQAWKNAGTGTRFAETLGVNIGSGVRSLDQAKAAVAEDLGRLQSQGAINPAEREEFERMMPNSWDSPEVVEQKFIAIQNRINAYR